jgi:hypothetical protein
VTRRRFAEQWSESKPRFRAAHAVAAYLEREGVAPLSAGGTVYSDEREMLDPDRDYWQPRVVSGTQIHRHAAFRGSVRRVGRVAGSELVDAS